MSTIAAISTAPGVGGIGIIRLSGEEAFVIIKKVFSPQNNSKIEGYKIKYGRIVNPKTKEIIDEVLVSFFKAPKSYTTEDMCEINSHGGNVIIQSILNVCLENGAVLAEPGEFTKRAFLGGRIDLAQAEAVVDIINAKTKAEAINSEKQLEGYLSKRIKEIRKILIELMVDIEASIDYPEYDVEEVTKEASGKSLKEALVLVKKLESTFEEGKIIKEGIRTAIVGTPNAGKSSLLNAILKEDRAIVTEIEGTTRDLIEEFVNIKGIPLKIVDTAGIRQSEDLIEQIGIKKSLKAINNSELVIAIFDSTKELSKEDLEILELVRNKNAIIVLNKEDLNNNIVETDKRILEMGKSIIKISALKNEGIEDIYKEIEKMFNLNEINVNDGEIVTNTRHKEHIRKSIELVEQALEEINNNMPIDVTSISIKQALEQLGKITGDSVSEDIIKEIFLKFCLGK
ncbi:MAG: tRNA uridine-5-carboxymethylaminomethyl(34) synthesis GTPase MnmE [Lachnospiraceae bacterium]|jgi:tRNA modification GTPase|nr:tRNA uridine-5-carboxymethylaminomethyl(34) synthesis GTPase MnmE [Lachnospiraceae bacterium]